MRRAINLAAILPAFILATPLVLAVSAPALAQSASTGRQQSVAAKYQREQTRLEQLRARTDAGAALELGRLLKAGLLISPSVVVRQSDLPGAEEALRRAAKDKGPTGMAARLDLARLLGSAGRSDKDIREGAQLLQQVAEQGDPQVAVELAALYASGQGVPHDLGKAADLYRQALMAKEPDAAFGLARVEAERGNKDAAESFTAQGLLLLRLRAGTSATAAGDLALRYARGEGMPRDLDKAMELTRRALALGDTTVAVEFAKSLMTDQGGPADPKLATRLLREAMMAGSLGAARVMLENYAEGGSLDIPPAEARFLIDQMEASSDIDGMFTAAALYEEGRGVPRDPARANELYQRVQRISRGDPVALLKLGRSLRDGRGRQAGDIRRAYDFLKAAADLGSVEGKLAAAKLVLGNPETLAGEAERSRGWLDEASRAGNLDAAMLMGDSYRKGIGVAPSDATAARYYDVAIEQHNSAPAMERRAALLLDSAKSRTEGLKALALYQRAAEAGRPHAMTEIGRFYVMGRYVSADPGIAERWYLRAVELGYVPAMLRLGELYENGPPAIASPEKAKAIYERAWSTGLPEAGVRYARILKANGQLKDAIAIFEQAAIRGNAAAAMELAQTAYAPGGVDKARVPALVEQAARLSEGKSNDRLAAAQIMMALPDPAIAKRGIELIEEVDRMGDGAATRVLAEIYVAGKLVPFDAAKAEEWARRSAARGAVQPQLALAAEMLQGGRMPKDVQKSVAFLEDAHKRMPTNVQAIVTLGRVYQVGLPGVPQDVRRAFLLFQSAAELGSVQGQVRTARAYSEGSGTPRSPENAIIWYSRAADQGSGEAMMELGRFYAAGEGVALDAEQAFGFFYRAAEDGSAEAMVEVGKSMLVGYGTATNVPGGVVWLEKAANTGNVTAMYDLFNFFSLRDPSLRDGKKAVAWLRKAIEGGSAEAAFRLALLYRDGDMVPQSEAEMKRWLARASDTGHAYSGKLLAKLAKVNSGLVAHQPEPNDTGDEEQ